MAAFPMTVAMERMPCPPTPQSIMSFFMAWDYLFLFLRAKVCIHSLRGMITDTPL